MKLLEQYGQVKVGLLAEELGVSALTIRRDLDYLESLGLIRRSYGQATLLNPVSTAFSSNKIQCKQAIAKAAAGLVRDQDTVLINTSSTALMILNYISAKNVTVITNNGKVLTMDLNPQFSVVLTGGELRFPKEALVGDVALANLQRVNADWAFIGCSGLTPTGGVSTAVLAESSVNRLMMERAERVVIVADYTKIGTDSNFPYADLSLVDQVITDQNASRAVLRTLKRMGKGVTLADAEDYGLPLDWEV